MYDKVFCKGYTWGFGSREGEMLSENARISMQRLADDGCDWICITVNAFQESFSSLRVFSAYGITQTDEEIIHAIDMAKGMGMKVCLKPMVNCLDHAWRARIDFPTEYCEYWGKWFESYTRFMLHYAKLAQRKGCEMLCTGCEMAGMDKQAEHCRRMIAEVRKVYGGFIMHNINHGDELRFEWLDAVDIIGISGYYPVSTISDRSADMMRSKWAQVVPVLEKCSQKYGRPVMFAEIGVRSESGCTAYPWDFMYRPERENDEQEQADFYLTAMECTWDLDYFAGYFWWDWKCTLPPAEKIHTQRDFMIYGKKAEEVMTEWYKK